MKTLTKALFLILVLVPAVALVAQETTFEIRNGTVVATANDQLVVQLTDGNFELIAIPPGMTFNVDGKDIALADLKPGTKLTAEITTRTTPTQVRTTEIRNAEVMKVAGGNLWVKENGKIKTYNIPHDFMFYIDGNAVPISELRPGQRLTAELVYLSEHTHTARELKVSGIAPPPDDNTQMASATTEVPAPAPELPKTASDLPLIALLGAGLIATGVAVRRA